MSQKFPKPRESAATNSVNRRKHGFYLDQQMNSSVPSWFIECSRSEAEKLLTQRENEGNVLMRPSRDNPYALSIRTVTNGVARFNHYAVQRNSRGEFFMDIDNRHSPMPTLSQVIELFIQLAGSSNHRAFGTRPSLTPTSRPHVILPDAVTASNSVDLLVPVSPINALPSVAASSESTSNPYIDVRSPVASAKRSLERLESEDDYIHPAQSPVVQSPGKPPLHSSNTVTCSSVSS
jgi:hypothetical protein